MTIAARVSQYLRDQSVDYQLIQHPHSHTSRESAHAAHVREDQVAKAILLKDDEGYVMAVIPASSSLDMRAVHEETGRNHLEMVTEDELGRVFPDCELGALPPLGQAYGIATLLDSSLSRCDTVYFEAGDHEELVEMDGSRFTRLFSGSRSCDLSKDWP
ncbi:Ala-tRNA(Pro) deacylase [Microbulbifer donghaiensis]|uniref:Ala-tRNA(Pro) deacylase n=1 Tax=Microbulbifer donghaiensis TaxID=494016 RepID=A0A1M5HPC6_9GAMM|nr:YbaK/EbsC family protein [Microbulbifer donghaiensis]SHG17781.1 Ala-tRNA(Pro) deacylase [Microbulbifer donghaiensis]